MRLLRSLPFLLLVPACTDVETPDGDGHGHEHGLVTTVDLVFTPDGGGDAQTFTWADPEDDGDPIVDPIVLSEGVYTLDIQLFNELEDPVEEVTPEVLEEGEEHQIFLTGSGVQSEATGDNPAALLDVSYGDSDAGGLPLGLVHDVTTLQTGDRELVFTLRHLPEEDGSATKVAGLAEDVAAGGFGSIPGGTDVTVNFDVTVE